MKRLILFLFFIIKSPILFAKSIDVNTAEKVGTAFIKSKINSSRLNLNPTLNLIYKTADLRNPENVYFYVFNIDSNGFIIVSGDDNVTPILSYSDEDNFDPNNIGSNIKQWFENYSNQIQYIIENNITATSEIKRAWNYYYNYKGGLMINPCVIGDNTSRTPLIQTKWNQINFYNEKCPFDTQYNQRTATGCNATAMSQIMKYWNYPNTGTGSHSYNDPKYGTVSADFGNTRYNWNLMPVSLNSSNDAVSTLLFHAGVSLNTDYNVASQGGSSSSTLCVITALKSYFDYSDMIDRKIRANYSDSDWKDLLKSELNLSRPVIYAGYNNNNEGHTFVCDGYDENDFFHFNWGWGGTSDGYFLINKLNPNSSLDFNQNQRAITGIQPSKDQSFLGTNNSLSPSQNTVSVYPNPANDFITIKVNDNSYYQLFDINGKTIFEGNLDETTNKINLENQKTGLYILNVINLNNQQKETVKILIK